MSRQTFLTVASIIALAVGMFASFFPATLLDSKGVAANVATLVWVREVGVLLISVGITAFLVRRHRDSATLQALLTGNAILQLGLLAIEPTAYVMGIVTKLSGIVPNTLLHALLGCGFAWFAFRTKRLP